MVEKIFTYAVSIRRAREFIEMQKKKIAASRMASIGQAFLALLMC